MPTIWDNFMEMRGNAANHDRWIKYMAGNVNDVNQKQFEDICASSDLLMLLLNVIFVVYNVYKR